MSFLYSIGLQTQLKFVHTEFSNAKQEKVNLEEEVKETKQKLTSFFTSKIDVQMMINWNQSANIFFKKVFLFFFIFKKKNEKLKITFYKIDFR